jgi:hypothetical protein
MPDYVWEELYQVAMMTRSCQIIQASKAAIDGRLHALQLDHGGTPEERQAITDALHGLDTLRQELETRLDGSSV